MKKSIIYDYSSTIVIVPYATKHSNGIIEISDEDFKTYEKLVDELEKWQDKLESMRVK